MVERVYPTESNKATFICPKCKNTKTVDVSKFANIASTVKVNSRCSCGHQWTSVLEKRKQYRKKVNLQGTYALISDGFITDRDRGGMAVTDLSAGGVKLKLNIKRNLQIGDRLNIEFRLDDGKRTIIKKDVVIRNISGIYIGAAFKSTDPYDPVMGFYLMS
jgi:urease gamma subunit